MPKRIARIFPFLLSVVLVTGVLPPPPALALEITPYELNFEVSPGQEQSKTITIFNDGSEKATYRIYPEEKYYEWFSFSPDEVELGPQQGREVTVTLRPPLTSLGKHDTFIYISPHLSGSGNPVALGMKLKASIDIGISLNSESDMMWLIIFVPAGVLALIFLFFVVIRPLTRRY